MAPHTLNLVNRDAGYADLPKTIWLLEFTKSYFFR